MDSLCLALAMLATGQCRIDSVEASKLSDKISQVESSHELPGGLLAAVVLAETGGRNVVSKQRRNGGFDHGVAQIHAKQVTPGLLDYGVNLDRAAVLLRQSEDKVCKTASCLCPWHGYNYNSKTWCKKVLFLHEQIQKKYLGCFLRSRQCR